MVASMDGPLSTGHRTLLITVSATTYQENTDENEWHQETRKKERSDTAYQELYKIVILRSFRSSWKVHWKKAIKRVFPRNLWGGYEGRRRRTRTQKNRLETAVLPRAFRRGEMARGSRTGQIYDRYTGHGQRATFTPAAITRHYRD